MGRKFCYTVIESSLIELYYCQFSPVILLTAAGKGGEDKPSWGLSSVFIHGEITFIVVKCGTMADTSAFTV